jgi:hypothetical protein
MIGRRARRGGFVFSPADAARLGTSRNTSEHLGTPRNMRERQLVTGHWPLLVETTGRTGTFWTCRDTAHLHKFVKERRGHTIGGARDEALAHTSPSTLYGGAALLRRAKRNIWCADRISRAPARVPRQDFTPEVLRKKRARLRSALGQKPRVQKQGWAVPSFPPVPPARGERAPCDMPRASGE